MLQEQQQQVKVNSQYLRLSLDPCGVQREIGTIRSDSSVFLRCSSKHRWNPEIGEMESTLNHQALGPKESPESDHRGVAKAMLFYAVSAP